MAALRETIFNLVRYSGYPSDDVASHMHDEAAHELTKLIIKAVEERIEQWRSGIDQAAEGGSDSATRESNLLNDMEEAVFGD